MEYSNPTTAPFTAEWDTQFKGIYTPIPLRCYSSDGRYLLIRTTSGSRNVLYVYDFTEHKLHPLESPLGVNTSVNGLAIFGHYVAVNVVDYCTPYRLYVFDLNGLKKGQADKNAWHFIAGHEFQKKEKYQIQWNIDRFFPDKELIPVESVYLHAKDADKKRPLMVLVHGGPNSNVHSQSFK